LTVTDVWPWAAIVAAVAGASLILYVRRPRIGYLGAWCFITLAPTSSIIPIATEVAAERRMYLPLAGIAAYAAAGVALFLIRIAQRKPGRLALHARTAALAGGILVVVVGTALGAATVARNREYASPLTMAEVNLARWPSPGSEFLLGTVLAEAGDHPGAI